MNTTYVSTYMCSLLKAISMRIIITISYSGRYGVITETFGLFAIIIHCLCANTAGAKHVIIDV